MFESVLVRTFVIIYGLIAFLTAVLLWKNVSADDAIKNSGIAVATLLPLLIAVLPYLNLQTNKTIFSDVLIYDSISKEVVSGDKMNPYLGAYFEVFANVPNQFLQANDFQELMKARGFDLIENGIMAKLITQFQTSWDIDKLEQLVPTGRVTSFSISKVPSTQVSLDQIKTIFKHNPIIQTPDVLIGSGFTLPKNSRLRVKVSADSRSLFINNSNVDLEISISPIMGTVMQTGISGVLVLDTDNINRFYALSYRIALSMKPKRFGKYAVDMPRYHRWYKNISDILAEMDWENIQERINKSMLDKAVSKILSSQ